METFFSGGDGFEENFVEVAEADLDAAGEGFEAEHPADEQPIAVVGVAAVGEAVRGAVGAVPHEEGGEEEEEGEDDRGVEDETAHVEIVTRRDDDHGFKAPHVHAGFRGRVEVEWRRIRDIDRAWRGGRSGRWGRDCSIEVFGGGA